MRAYENEVCSVDSVAEEFRTAFNLWLLTCVFPPGMDCVFWAFWQPFPYPHLIKARIHIQASKIVKMLF